MSILHHVTCILAPS